MSTQINTFVINLPFDKDRRDFMVSELTNLAIPHTIVSATIGKDLSIEEINSLYDKNLSLEENGYSLSNTQIACADSHRRIYEKIVENNLPWALILEDDVKLSPKIKSLLTDDFVKRSQADWIQIDYVPANMNYLKNWIKIAWNQKVPLKTKLFKITLRFPAIILWSIFERTRDILTKTPRATWFQRPLYLASAYIVTNEGAKKLLPLTHPIRYAADSLQNVAPTKVGLKIKGVVPLLSNQLRSRFSSNLTYDS
jgi:GR25 family glycosyltransferase involved in LPS biosynthesis